ncbi:hypothetical protein VIPARAQ4037_A0249 [Vibrio parahaemolyticus AQ4037]|nr:hypothetical protein VIPARAQ4037_A0249 [Vibrio parahaemolyticus AQ4037]
MIPGFTFLLPPNNGENALSGISLFRLSFCVEERRLGLRGLSD